MPVSYGLLAGEGDLARGEERAILVDNYGRQIALSYDDFYVVQGRLYTVSYVWESLGAGATEFLILDVGTTILHVSIEVGATGLSMMRLWEGTAYTGGIVVSVEPLNRQDHGDPDLLAYHTAPITSFGTEAFRGLAMPNIFSGMGGPSQRISQWALQPGVVYAIEVTNTTGGAIYANVVVTIREEP